MSSFDLHAARRAFKARLAAENKSLRQWAVELGLSPEALYGVTAGVNRGLRGDGRRALRALGWPLPPAQPEYRQRRARRGLKPHLRLHIDGRLDHVEFRPRKAA